MELVDVTNRTIRKDIIDRAILAMKSNSDFDDLEPADRRHTIRRVLKILSESHADWWMDQTVGEKNFFMYVITQMIYNEVTLNQELRRWEKNDIERLNEELERSS